jgi:hypothetical protein
MGRFLEVLCLTMLYLVAKPSHVRPDVDTLACSLHHPTVCSHQRGGQSFLIGTAPSYHATMGSDVFPGDVRPPAWIFYVVLTVWLPTRPNVTWRSPFLSRACLSDIRVIMVPVCTISGVAMSSGDGMNSCTRVPTVRHAWGLWPCPVMSDNKYHHFFSPWHLVKFYLILEPSGWSNWMPGPISGRGGRWTEKTGGGILPAHIYRKERKGDSVD